MSIAAFADKKSINLNFMQQNLHYLHKEILVEPSFDFVRLKGPKFVGIYGYEETGTIVHLPMKEYLKQLAWSQSVFSALAGKGTGHGTAFYIGGNLVLTNKHVAQTTNNALECGKFQIDVVFPIKETITCKEVNYCSPQYDFCLIEMNNFKNGDSLDDHIPAFKLKNTKGINYFESIYAIGNAVNFGIQGSKAKKVTREKINNQYLQNLELFIHYAPTFGGSSGSPLIDSDGNVIGINFAEKMYQAGRFRAEVGDNFFNYAVPMDKILQEIKDNSPSLYATLGTSKTNFLSVDMLFEEIQNIKKMVLSDTEFNSLVNKLNNIPNIYDLSISKEETINSEILNSYLLTNITHTKNALSFLVNDQLSFTSLFIEKFNKTVINEPIKILKDKSKYQLIRNICQQNLNNLRAIDGCIFENSFFSYFEKFIQEFNLTKDKEDLIWNVLIKLANQSEKEIFNFKDSEIDPILSKYAIKEIKPINYFVECFLSIENKFKEFSKDICEGQNQRILKKYGFPENDSDFSNLFHYLMTHGHDFNIIVEKFKYNVTSMNFQCAFRNKRCKAENYRRFLKNWGYKKEIQSEDFEKMVAILVKYHQSFKF